MARPKLIDDATLINFIDQFFIHECNGRPSKLKKPEIVQYINSHGYPGYAVESLRRNKVACDYIESLKAKDEEKKLVLLTSHKTLDVETFLNTYRGKTSLTKALTELDCYYKTVADSAVQAIKEYKSLTAKIESLQDKLFESQTEINLLNDTISELRIKIKQLTAENAKWKGVVNDYVYPDICNELLAADKELKNVDTIIAEAKLSKKIISFNSKIRIETDELPEQPPKTESSVIQNLTSIFEEDDV